MNTKSRSRCAIKAARWASYAVAGAATAVLASNDAEAQILYSGVLNKQVGTGGSLVQLRELNSNSHQASVAIGVFAHDGNNQSPPGPGHESKASSFGFAWLIMNHHTQIGGAVGTHQVNGRVLGPGGKGKYGYSYASKLAFGAHISGQVFNASNVKNLMARSSLFDGKVYTYPGGQFKAKGIGYLAFEFNLGNGEQYGWARVNMTTGSPLNAYMLVDYAYGAPNQMITVGETTVPQSTIFTWTNGANTASWANPSNQANWNPTGGPPNGVGVTAIFANTSPLGIVTLDGNETVGVLEFSNGGSGTGMTINPGSPAGTLTLDDGANSTTVMVTVTAGSHTINAPIILNETANISLASGTGLTLGGAVTNGTVANGLTLTGSGTLSLTGVSGANTYSGATTITGGTLEAKAINTMSSASEISVGTSGILLLDGFSQSIGSLTGAGAVTNNSSTSATLTVGNDGTSPPAFAGVLSDTTGSSSGTLALTKIGAGTLILSGANTYSGGTAVNAGVLKVNNTTGLGTGSGPVMVNSGGSLGGTGTIGGPVTVNMNGTLAPGDPANLTINNSVTLAAGSILSYTLGTPGVANAGPSGGSDETTLTGTNGTLTLNQNETVNVAAGTGFGTGVYVLAHYTSLNNLSNGFSGWSVSGPTSNNYTFQIDTANKDVELVARPKAPVPNLYVSVNGAALAAR